MLTTTSTTWFPSQLQQSPVPTLTAVCHDSFSSCRQMLVQYNRISMSEVSIFHDHSFQCHFLTFHAWFWHIRMWPCGLCVGVTTVVPLHRPLSAQPRSVIHSTFVLCNSTAHVLFPVTVLQLTQIPPSSTDCLQIWQWWPTNTNHLYGMSLTCNCSVYCTLPRSVSILLQINMHSFLRLIVYFYYCFWNQIGVSRWKWIQRSWFRYLWQFCESEWITAIKTVLYVLWTAVGRNRFVHVNTGMKRITVMSMCSTFLLFMIWILRLTNKSDTI